MRKLSLSILILSAISVLQGCGHAGHSIGRTFLDSTNHKDSAPEWVTSTKTMWVHDDSHVIKATYDLKGTERVSACFDLARLNSKEQVLTSIKDDIRGRIDNAMQGVSEAAEIVLGKVRSAEYAGSVTGLKSSEEYFERFAVGDVERIQCYVLSEIKKSDYDAIKRAVIYKIEAADPRIKEAIMKKQIEFFDNGKADNSSASNIQIKQPEKSEIKESAKKADTNKPASAAATIEKRTAAALVESEQTE